MATFNNQKTAGAGLTLDPAETKEVIEIVNYILDMSTGLVMPEGTDGTNFLERLKIQRQTIERLTAAESKSELDPTGSGSAAIAASNPLRRPKGPQKPSMVDVNRNTRRILNRAGRVGR